MLGAGLTVAELEEGADLEPSTVVAWICGTEEARFVETLWLLDVIGLSPDEFAARVEEDRRGDPGERPGDHGPNPARPGRECP
jgi:hypothetical protein